MSDSISRIANNSKYFLKHHFKSKRTKTGYRICINCLTTRIPATGEQEKVCKVCIEKGIPQQYGMHNSKSRKVNAPESKKKRKKRIKGTRRILQAYANKMRKYISSSEKWFIEELNKTIGFHRKDIHQKIDYANKWIPDWTNKELKYIIEVDGTSHRKLSDLDRYKDQVRQDMGYKVIRVIAYNQNSFEEAIIKLIEFRGEMKEQPVIDEKTRLPVPQINLE